MSTAGPLSDRSKKELADLARRRGVRGWESMTKEQLVRAIARAVAKTTKTVKATKTAKVGKTAKAAPPRVKAKPAASRPAARPAVRPAPKPVLVPKPATKSAAKVTRPAKPTAKPAPAPVPRPVVRPTPNGAHGPTTGNGVNGASKPAAVPLPTAQRPVASKPTLPVASKPTLPVASKPTLPVASKPTLPVAAPKPAAAAAPKLAAPVVRPPVLQPVVGKEAPPPRPPGPAKDRILLMVPDPYWLHAYWELTNQSIQRAEAALKQDWHGARQVIRLFDVTSQDTTSTSETPVRDIVLHPGCNNWYIDVPQPPRTYRADIGYMSRRGEFFVLARSNQVTPPKAGSTEAVEVGWSDLDSKKAERILAMSSGFETTDGDPELKRYLEERLRRPMGAPKDTAFGSGAVLPGSIKKFFFELDAKLVVLGRSDPTAHVTLGNEPVRLNPDGSFIQWFSLPDSRQIIPAVATSADGVEERTIVLAVERNTKHLDPMIHDQMNEG
jgi:hypothetical protein